MDRILFLCLALITSITFLDAQIEVTNSNNVGVSLAHPNYKMRIHNDVRSHSLFIENSYTGSSVFGLYNKFEASGSSLYGIYNLQNGVGAKKYAVFNKLTGFGSDEDLFGMRNEFIGNSRFIYGIENIVDEATTSSTTVGVVNRINGTSTSKFGISSRLDGPTTSIATGVTNTVYTTGSNKTGFRNDVRGSGFTEFNRGLNNILNGSNKIQYSISQSLSGQAEEKYGA